MYIFILNSFTLKNRIDEVRYKIMSICEELGIDYDIELNSNNLSTEEIVRKYKNKKVILVAIGGDGIINRVINAMDMVNNKLAFIPCGTGNDLYKSVKMYLNDGDNLVDLVRINDRYFVNAVCFGIDAMVGNSDNLIRCKYIPRKWRYTISLLVTFFKYRCRKLEVYLDNEIINDYFVSVVLANGCYYGGGYYIAPSAKLDDDFINVYLLNKVNKFKMIKLILKMKNGHHEEDNLIRKYKVKELFIRSDKEIDVNIDGEEMVSKEFKIEMAKNKLMLVYNSKLINKFLER